MAPELFWGHDETDWLGIAALAQVVLAFSVPTTILLSWWEQRRSRQEFERTEREKFYIQLDEMYLRILKIAVDHPEVRSAEVCSMEKECPQYDSFAFIMWNFLETIYDFVETDKSVLDTWECIFDFERAAHAKWFKDSRSSGKFKKGFRDDVLKDLTLRQSLVAREERKRRVGGLARIRGRAWTSEMR